MEDKPETFYGPHTDEETRAFVSRHVRKTKPPKLNILDALRGRKSNYVVEFDAKGMDEATRYPFFRREGKFEPIVPQGKFVTRKGKTYKVG